ncbi:MAG: sigma 54-interacting transcriptional regulator [Myxococcales bacterium]
MLAPTGKPAPIKRSDGDLEGWPDEDDIDLPTRRLLALQSAAMQAAMAAARKAAGQDSIILLVGESGTGKDHLAEWIHRNSSRRTAPFFSVNCAALTKELAESELFGHEQGAFTGTKGRKRGLVELADGGTLLLNEIGELDLGLQSKLLTFLDTFTFVRLGGERSVRINSRLLAATNRDLAAEVEKRTFRRDLYYRLNVFPIHLPALRERLDDLPLLVSETLDLLTSRMGLRSKPQIGGDVIELLRLHPWSGNIRELRNVLERAIILSGGERLERQHVLLDLPSGEWSYTVRMEAGRTLHDVARDVSRRLVREALRKGSSKQEAAKILGITRHALAYQMKILDIED